MPKKNKKLWVILIILLVLFSISCFCLYVYFKSNDEVTINDVFMAYDSSANKIRVKVEISNNYSEDEVFYSFLKKKLLI